MSRIRRATAAVLTCWLALTACSGPAASETKNNGPRPLTADEADRVALARFTTYRRGTGNVTTTIPSQGRTITLTGRVDWRRHLGYAEIRNDAEPPVRELVQWTITHVTTRPHWTGGLPKRPPATGWETHRLTPHRSPLDTALILLLNLGTDRPDNAQLLARSSARLVRQDRIAGTPVIVVAGPAAPTAASQAASDRPALGNTRYWIDRDGRLLRFQARAGGESAWMTADLSRTAADPLPSPPPAAATPAPSSR
ncbi:hypothetical protein [Streptomyces sp. NPDC015130]|uniref:hypothetical protein n=1 Tax=Streptomyces sp. NPDC015130 TaxID=3364940 RepID=UPI0036FE7CB8